MDTRPGGVGRPSPVYERPIRAEIINGTEKIDIEKIMAKEIKIEKNLKEWENSFEKPIVEIAGKFTPINTVTEEDKCPTAIKLRKDFPELTKNKTKIIDIEVPDSEKPLNVVEMTYEQIPVGARIKNSDIEVVKPQTDFKDTDTDCDFDEKENLSLGEWLLKEYAKDKKREEIKRDMSKYIMNDQEEEKIKNMLHLKETKKDNDAVAPGDFDGICKDLMALHARKNKDYGNAAHESYKEFGLISYVIRLNDKMKRLKSLTKPGVEQEVKSESIEDTLMDLAAYAIMAIESLRS